MPDLPPPPYVQLQSQATSNNIKPPPYHRNVPKYTQRHRRSFCCRCICCCCCSLLLLILICAGLAYYIYAYRYPKQPTYKVTNLEVKSFNIQHDFSLKTEISVSVRADNPNKDIGIIYGEDSSVDVIYNHVDISSGKLPAFHQGPQNVTVMQMHLQGVSQFGSGLQEAMTENKHDGKIPVVIKIKAPVKLVFWGLKLKQFFVSINCDLVVDNLAPNKKINVLSSKYVVDFDV